MNAITFPVNGTMSDHAEDAEIKVEKTKAKTMKTVVVFNPGNMEAVVAAAIVKDRYPAAMVVDVAKAIPSGADQYLWLGVEPSVNMIEDKSVWRKDHIVAFSGKPLSQFKVSVGGPSWKTLQPKESYQPNLAGRVLDYLRIDAGRFAGLVDMVHRFYDKDLDISTLAFIYEGCKTALASLSGSEFFLAYPSLEQQERYMAAVKAAKTELHGNVAVQTGKMKGVKTTFAQFCNVKDVWLCRRLISFTYAHYAHTKMRLNGPSFEANFKADGFGTFENVAVLN